MHYASSSNHKRFSSAFLGILLIVAFTLALPIANAGHFSRAQAATVDELKKKSDQLEQQAKQAEQQAKTQKSVAERAADKVEQVNSQIGELEGNISTTDQNISETQVQIGQKNQEVASLEAELRKVKDQQDALVRQIYIMRMSLPDALVMFSNESVSKREQDQAQFQALKKSLGSIYAKTSSAKLAVETTRNDLMQKSKDLENMKAQQQEQKTGLADVRLEQAQLRENAEEAVVALEEKAKKARSEEAKVEQQISAALTAAIKANSNGKLTGTSAGQRVRRGDVVGHLGSTGNSSGPHVHFEVRVNNSPVNPSPYVSNGTLTWPVKSFQISQGFGYTDYAQGGAYGGAIHTGIDLAGPYGQPVFAPADGVVILRQYYGGYGNAWAEQLDSGLVVLLGHMTGS